MKNNHLIWRENFWLLKFMTTEEGISIIRDKNSRWEMKVEAAAYLAENPNTPLSYFVECLSIRGLPQDFAAIALYKRTRRHRADDSLATFIKDATDWANYLTENSFITLPPQSQKES